MEEEKQSKLSKGTVILMTIVVIFFEVLNLILNFLLPEIGPMLSGIVSSLLFGVWFKIKGVSFGKDPKRMLAFLGGGLLDEFEGADEVGLPTQVFGTIASVWAEEAIARTTGIELSKNSRPKMKPKQVPPAPQRQSTIGLDRNAERTPQDNEANLYS